jgi:hypothetical protein
MVMMRLVMVLFVIGLAGTSMAAVETGAGTEGGEPGETRSEAGKASPWIAVAADEPVLTLLDVPLLQLHKEPEKYLGRVFQDRFKYYHTYRDREDTIPALSRQTIVGETHFTARPVQQPIHMIRIRITPEQDAWLRDKGVRRQDVVKARVRFAGFAPNGTLAFDLLEVEESVRSWRLRRTGE